MNGDINEKSLEILDHFIEQKQHQSDLKACTLDELMLSDLPEPEPIIAPLLYEGDLCMIYGWRGAGKTWFSLWLAYCIASGISFLGWECAKSRRVLVLDGEMRAARLKKRLSLLINGAQSPQPLTDQFHILTRDLNPESGQWPDLGTICGREAILDVIQSINPDVIILDNISAWVRSGKNENDEESWRGVAGFLMQLRTQGRAVVLIHHSGKSGTQRGTSKREDILDTVIALKRPEDYDQREGLRVEIVFEKSRNLDGAEIPQVEVHLEIQDDAAIFVVQESQSDPISIAHVMINAGASRNEIMQTLNMNRFQLMRLEEKAQKQGRGFKLPDGRNTNRKQ